jgi:hypothetical protein
MGMTVWFIMAFGRSRQAWYQGMGQHGTARERQSRFLQHEHDAAASCQTCDQQPEKRQENAHRCRWSRTPDPRRLFDKSHSRSLQDRHSAIM